MKQPIDPNVLEPGQAYRLSRKTPLMPHYDPPDPLRALRQAKMLGDGVMFTVRQRALTKMGLWYRVAVMASTGEVVVGWIKVQALMGQRLERAI